MREELYGQDILLGEDGEALVAANGELVLSDGVQTAVQDIGLRLKTLLGSLFYDKEFGSEIPLYIQDENTPTNRMGLVTEVERCIGMEPRVVTLSPRAKIVTWDHLGVQIEATFQLIDEQHAFNLIIEIGADMEVVIKDVNPGQ